MTIRPLAVQTYLRTPGHTLETLAADYAIKVRLHEDIGVVVLNYDQIESPKAEEVVRDCRGLILGLGSWNVFCMPFRRFFNLGEGVGQEFDWSNFEAYEKLDGTLISFWHHPRLNQWFVSTRSTPDASAPVDGTDLTFKELVAVTLVDMGTSLSQFISTLTPEVTYHFELTAPENRVVVAHPTRKLTLLTCRDQESRFEIRRDVWQSHFLKVPAVSFTSKEELLAAADLLNPIEHEGFVVRDVHGNRLKIKSEAYCLLSKSRDQLAKSRLAQFELILTGKADDAYGLLPEFVQKSMGQVELRLQAFYSCVSFTWRKVRYIPDQKEFALAVQEYPFKSLLFTMRKEDAGTIQEHFLTCASRNPRKALEMVDNSWDLYIGKD